MLAVAHEDTLTDHHLRQLTALCEAVVVCEPPGATAGPWLVDVLRVRRSGRDQRRSEAYVLAASGMVMAGSRTPGGGTAAAQSRSTGGPRSAPAPTAPDPASNLTFNLRLSEREQTARAATAAPYVLGREQKERALQAASAGATRAAAATIFYEPDEGDDFDDEDPDDDLDL